MWESFFAPRGVVVVGASHTPTKLGYGAARNLVVSEYPGAIHFVNPKGGELFGRPIHARLADVPDPVDLAVILIPAASVPQALEDCGRRGIPAAIIGSGGFRETGPDGVALEARCLEIARRHGIRLVGPNCIGLLDTHFPIDTTFLPLPGPIPGDIAFLSHSGAICEAVIDWARGQGFGLSRLVSLGNQLDLTEADFLAPTVADPHTRVVAMYLEGIADGRKFVAEASRAARQKPLVAIKVGRSQGGRRAVASHTGALAGRDAAYDAAFRKAGVLRAENSEEVFDWARALAWCPLPRGPRMAVLTNAGGPGAIAVDALETHGLALAELAEETKNFLRGLLPPAASVRNPVDMLAGAGTAEYASGLSALLSDPGVDGLILVLPPPPMTTAAEVAGAIIPIIRASGKPVVVALMGEDLIVHAARLLRQARVPDYRFPERAAMAMGVLWRRACILASMPTSPERPAGIRPEEAARILAQAPRGADGFIESQDAARLAAAYGVTSPEGRLAQTADEAALAARQAGLPVALKIASADIPHKTDVGGVRLGLKSEPEVARAFDEMRAHVAAAQPTAHLLGAIVQPMQGEGQDVILGVVRDEQFGPLVMFGAGGVEVESLRDVAFGLAPLSRVEAEALVDSTQAGRRLMGGRGVAPADRGAVVDALLRLAQLAVDRPELAEIEVNPLRVFEPGAGVAALDVRLRLAPDSAAAA
jgi:acetyltransferase